MKKYIVSILVASVFLIGAPFMAQKASAADLNIRDFVNLLVAIGVISTDKMPAVNAFLATFDNQSQTESVSYKTYRLNDGGAFGSNSDFASFEIKYPANWKYREFSYNVEGIAFCPQNIANCGVGMMDMKSTVTVYPHKYDMTGNISGNSATHQNFKNEKGEIIASASLSDLKYQKEFGDMLSSFKLINSRQFQIIITSPEGDIYKKGDDVPIKWRVENFGLNTLTIDLLKSDGTLVYNLGSLVNPLLGSGNNAPFTWVIPRDGAPGGRTIDLGRYKVRICRHPNPQADFDCDTSGVFTIISSDSNGGQSSVKIISPNGGENLIAGNNISITWTANNAESFPSGTKLLLVKRDTAEIATEVILNPNPGSGTHTSNALGTGPAYSGKYFVKVCLIGNSSATTLCDSSDSYLNLVSDNGDGSLYPSLDLLDPEVSGLIATQNGVTYPVTGQIDTTWCKKENPNASGSGPFEFNWNDGNKSCSWFPATHTYATGYQWGESGMYKITVRVKNTAGLISERYKLATPPAVAVYPVCGSAQNVARTSMPISNLCSEGTVGKVSGASTDGTDRWFWGCVGQNTGWKDDTAWCFAPKITSATSPSVMYPVCGTAKNTCSVGTLGENDTTADGTNRWYWACVGKNTDWTNDTAWCFAPKTSASADGQNYATVSLGWDSFIKLIQALR